MKSKIVLAHEILTRAIDKWIRNEPADLLVCCAHVKTFPLTYQHFLEVIGKVLHRDQSPLEAARIADIFEAEGSVVERDLWMDLFGDVPEDAPDRRHFLRRLTEKDAETFSETPWVIDGIVPENSLVVVYGQPGSGKSFVLLDWAVHACTGSPWLGRRTTQGGALCFVGEGQEGFKKRIVAAKWGRFESIPGFTWYRDVIDLTNTTQADKFLEEIQDLQPKIITLDTLSHYRGAAEENSATEMAPVLRTFDRAREVCGSAIVVAHHPSKSDNTMIRGSGSILGSADVAIHIEGDGHRASISCKKMKDAEFFRAINVELVLQEWAHPETGRPMGSLQVHEGTAPPAAQVRTDRKAQKVEDFLRANAGRDFSIQEIAEGARVRRADIKAIVDGLVGRGLVVAATGGRGDRWMFDEACAGTVV